MNERREAPSQKPDRRAACVWPACVAGVLALLLYGRTLAPGLTWAHDGADGGDFLSAALTGGIPHPPGYPTYTLLLRAAMALLPVSPARAGNWLSAGCAALAVALAGLIAVALGATPWVLAAGVIGWLAAVAVTLTGFLWARHELPEPRPRYWPEDNWEYYAALAARASED